jgi:cellulase
VNLPICEGELCAKSKIKYYLCSFKTLKKKIMNKLVSLVAFLWLIIACEKSGEDNDPSTQTSTTQIPYDWDFYLEPSRLNAVKKEPNVELKKLYYQVYGTPCGGWYDGMSPNSEKNNG